MNCLVYQLLLAGGYISVWLGIYWSIKGFNRQTLSKGVGIWCSIVFLNWVFYQNGILFADETAAGFSEQKFSLLHSEMDTLLVKALIGEPLRRINDNDFWAWSYTAEPSEGKNIFDAFLFLVTGLASPCKRGSRVVFFSTETGRVVSTQKYQPNSPFLAQ